MHLYGQRLRVAHGRALLEIEVASDGLPKTLWFSVPERFRDLFSDSLDGALVALLIAAMATGERLRVSGAVSEKIRYGLAPLQALLREVMPFLKAIDIDVQAVSARRPPARGVATGFSGGIDSFCVLADHHYRPPSPGYRITHLLCNNVGSHGEGGQALFRRRHQRLLPLTERLGLPLIDVDSNLDSFYGGRLHFEQTHTLRNAGVALLLGGGIGRFLYASAYGFRDVAVAPYHSTALTDLISLPLLSSETTQCLSVGSEYSRVEKTVRVAGLADSHDALDVCTKTWTDRNCGRCPKCMRTLLTLEIAGKLDLYERVFDMAAWRHARSGYLGRVFKARDPFSREIAAFAQSTGFPRTPYSRLYGAAWQAKESVKRLAGLRVAA